MPQPPDEDVVPVEPLKSWLDRQGRGARAKLSKDLGISQQVITNWLTRRSLPATRLRAVVKVMGISTDAYLSGKVPEDALPTKVEQPVASYLPRISATKAVEIINEEIAKNDNFDPGHAWTGLLTTLMTEGELSEKGAREVLQLLASFQAAKRASAA